MDSMAWFSELVQKQNSGEMLWEGRGGRGARGKFRRNVVGEEGARGKLTREGQLVEWIFPLVV